MDGSDRCGHAGVAAAVIAARISKSANTPNAVAQAALTPPLVATIPSATPPGNPKRERLLAATPASGPLATLFSCTDAVVAGADEVAWYAERLPHDAGSVLEAMVGAGRILVPLVESGLAVHGVDASAPMLAVCAARMQASGHTPHLFRQEVASLNLPFRYAAAYIASGSFQSLADRPAAVSTLLRIRAHLLDPGTLLLDLVVPEKAEHPPGAAVIEVRHVTMEDGSRIARRSETRYDTDNRRIHSISRYERREGNRVVEREDENTALTWYSEAEISALLVAAGYTAIRIESSPLAHERARGFAVSAQAGRAPPGRRSRKSPAS